MSDQITNSEKMMSREDRDWLTLIDHAWFAMTGKPWPPYAARNLPDWRAANMGALFSSITALVKALSDRQHCEMCGGRGIRPCGSEGHPEPCECYDAADELLQQFPALLPLETHPPVSPVKPSTDARAQLNSALDGIRSLPCTCQDTLQTLFTVPLCPRCNLLVRLQRML